MKKCIAILLTFMLLILLASCAGESAVLGETKTYDVTSDIHSLDIQINSAEFVIEYGDKISVESNLRDLTVSEENGVLKIYDKPKPNVSYTDAVLFLYLPDDASFEDIKINTGAAKLSAPYLSADSIELKLGAGLIEIGCLNAYSNIDIQGGAGKITVDDGVLNGLNMELGTGALDMTAALMGNSALEFGTGTVELNLIDNGGYVVDIKQGLGVVTFNGEKGSHYVCGDDPQNFITIKGGFGKADITVR